jgi:hypothetical protein
MMLPWMKVFQAEPLRLASRSSTSLIRHRINTPMSEIAFHGVYAKRPGGKKSHFTAYTTTRLGGKKSSFTTNTATRQ